MAKILTPVIIIQARENSSRLKHKVLKKIIKKSIIEIMFDRLSKLKKFQIHFVIPHKNNKLKKEISQFHNNIFEGDEIDVLSRYYNCAKSLSLDKKTPIIRLTSDCPLIDHNLIKNFYKIFIENNYQYLSNTLNPSYPDGMDIEIFTFDTLQNAYRNSYLPHDREHVTPYIKRSVKNKYNVTNSTDLSEIRLTLDTKEDFLVIKKIISKIGHLSSLTKITNCYNNMNLSKINKNLIRNQGSITNEDILYWERAKKVIPGGNSLYSKRPELNAPNLWPSHYEKAKGYKIWSKNKKKYSDLSTMGVGTNILGYANQKIDNEVIKSIKKSNMSTLNAFEEVLLAEKLIDMHPWAQKVKFARTGAEANSIAIRLARAYSKKNEVAICGYHGWHDWYLSASMKNKKNFSKNLMDNVGNIGTPSFLKKYTHSFLYNDLDYLKNLINTNKNIGTVIMEVMRNFEPKNNFLKKVRSLCDRNGIILIFDECTSGFRETFGGLHLKYGINPDIAMFGKSLGNGYAINAIIGKNEVMNMAKKSFISSTFWTERSGSVAALKTLEIMEKTKSWKVITEKGKFIKKRWRKLADANSLKINIFGLDSLPKFTLPYRNWMAYKTFITQEFLNENILATNTIYLSTVHDHKILEKYLKKLDEIFSIINKCELGEDIYSFLKNSVCANDFTRLN